MDSNNSGARKYKLLNYLIKVMENYSKETQSGEEYFTFVKHNDRIVCNLCREDEEIDSFFIDITPSDKKFRFNKSD